MSTTLEPIRDASTLTVWTYKEGLLSKVAHDLCIDATGWHVHVTRDGDVSRVEVTVPVTSLRVRGQVSDGKVTPLRDKDHREIEGNLQGKAVLDAARHPQVRWTGRGALPAGAGVTSLEGELTLAGTTRPLAITSHVRDDPRGQRVDGEVRFRQTTFGVKPYSAMLGALRVQDEVRVAWSLLFPKA